MNPVHAKVVASRLHPSLSSSGDIRSVAQTALLDGCDTPSLRVLARLVDSELDEAKLLATKVIDELGFGGLSEQSAVQVHIHDAARAIVLRTIPPYQGAKIIWKLSQHLPGDPPEELHTFIYGASEWESRPEDAGVFAEGIWLAARDFLSEADIR